MNNIFHKVSEFGVADWLLIAIFFICYILIGVFINHCISQLRISIKIKLGAGISGTMKYVTSESRTVIQNIIIGGQLYPQQFTYTDNYGSFYDSNNNLITNKAIINGSCRTTGLTPAIYYKGTIYTDGGKSNTIISWILMIVSVILLICMSFFLYTIVS